MDRIEAIATVVKSGLPQRHSIVNLTAHVKISPVCSYFVPYILSPVNREEAAFC